ncbi:DUF4124 domain-containing protein [Xanthomonas sp. AmX2]|uniref:DUF4124 domain-containing protein n=1 Tax=Xanthomonas sp. TaxID=29446 RepID=UPI00197F6A84|nr:DUF4124 domain-containing protein [Xanthomonas sp.]MBN6150337.1 DUF4124 domain-containing protein [Xanthomonas sp.]
MRALTRLCCLCLFASSAASAATIYQWKDAQGVTHYSESPPAGQKYEARRIDARGGTAIQAEAAGAPAENANCTTARKNLDLLNKPAPVMSDNDGDGKPDGELSAAQRESQKTLAEAAIKAYCTPANPGT